MRGGAFLKGKEGRVGFRKNLLPLRIFVQITLIIMCLMMCAQTDCMNVQTFAQINIAFLRNFLAYYRNSSYICSRKKIPTSERRLSLI